MTGKCSPSNSTTNVSKSMPSLVDTWTLSPEECVEPFENVKEKLIKDLGLVELGFKNGEPRSILINKELKMYKTFKSVESNYKRHDQYFVDEEDLRETLEGKGWVGPWESKDKVKHWSDICSKICLLEGLDYQAANCRAGAYPYLTVRKECQGLRFQQLKKKFEQGRDYFLDKNDLQDFAYYEYNWTGPDGYRPVQEVQKRTPKQICDLVAEDKEQKENLKNYANLKTYLKEKKEKDKKRKKSNLDDDGRNRNAKVSKTTKDDKTVKTSNAVSAHSRKCQSRSAAKKAKTTTRKKYSLSNKSINRVLPKRNVKGGSGSKSTTGTKTSTAKLNDKEMDVEYNLPEKKFKCLNHFLKQKEEAVKKVGKSKGKVLHGYSLNCLEMVCKGINKFNQGLVQLVTNVEVGDKIVEIFQKQQDETEKSLEKYCDDEKLKDVLMKHLEKILESIDSANKAVLKLV